MIDLHFFMKIHKSMNSDGQLVDHGEDKSCKCSDPTQQPPKKSSQKFKKKNNFQISAFRETLIKFSKVIMPFKS